MLVDDRIYNFNKNRDRNHDPSDSICVDESISRWYGIVGHWINAGLPQYIEIDRKPVNGCEIQNTADGVSVIMIQLKLVKTSSEEDLHSPEEHDGLLHGNKLMLNIFLPWVNKQRRDVISDIYFALVQSCDDLKKRGLSFICVVKTATSVFCMEKIV